MALLERPTVSSLTLDELPVPHQLERIFTPVEPTVDSFVCDTCHGFSMGCDTVICRGLDCD